MDKNSERQVRIGDDVVGYSLKRSKRRRKTVGIKVAQGVVDVTAPTRTAIREIEEILRKRGAWILERMEAASQLPPPRQLVSGETLPLLGGKITLRVEESEVRRASASSEGGELQVLVPQAVAEGERRELVSKAVVRWYRQQVETYLKESVARWLPVMGRSEMPRVLVREQRSRWGSCSNDGTLRFSWRLGMLEPGLIDSVVVHELAHLDVMNHSPAFWEVVLRAMPDARDRRKRLNEVGRLLPL